MDYHISTTDGKTLIERKDIGFNVRVSEEKPTIRHSGSSYGLGTLYVIRGGFVPEKVYLFLASETTTAEQLKITMDLFFTAILGTDLYIKEIPPDSALFEQEVKRLFGSAALESRRSMECFPAHFATDISVWIKQ